MTVGFSLRDWDPREDQLFYYYWNFGDKYFFTLRLVAHWPFFYIRGSSGPVLYPAISDGNKNRE